MSHNKKQVKDPHYIQEVLKRNAPPQYLSMHQIAEELGITYHTVMRILQENLSTEEYYERKRMVYSRSKTGVMNPMFGKFGDLHHRFIGDLVGEKGYTIRLRPNWFTGYPSQKHVPVHQIVICEALGMTEIPEGWVVHHVDMDPSNNDLSNLALLTASAHQRLHNGSQLSNELTLWELHEFLTWKLQKTTAS